jgi:hypothetical protein
MDDPQQSAIAKSLVTTAPQPFWTAMGSFCRYEDLAQFAPLVLSLPITSPVRKFVVESRSYSRTRQDEQNSSWFEGETTDAGEISKKVLSQIPISTRPPVQ